MTKPGTTAVASKASLEQLVETQDLGIEVLHPGGSAITLELAALCGIGRGTDVLDVACGTGESACLLAEKLGADVVGLDASEYLLERAREKARRRGLELELVSGDAHRMSFADDSFDAVISECTLCLLQKEAALGEMVRVTRPGGRVGMHDVCWTPAASDTIKARLEALEGERPETLAGWKQLFESAGLVDIETVEKPALMRDWTHELERSLGLAGQLNVFYRVVKRWGVSGLLSVLASERIFRSPEIGYAIVVGTKPS